MNEIFQFARDKGLSVKFKPLKHNDGSLKGNRIALGEHLKEDEAKATFILAHEIAHWYLHKDKGDTINNPLHNEYEEQANRAALMMIAFINFLHREKLLKSPQ